MELGHHIQHHIRQVEGDVGDEQRPECQTLPLSQHLAAHEHEQQAQGNTGDDIRVCHGNVGQAHGHLPQTGLQIVDAHSGNGTENGGRDGGQAGDDQRVGQQVQQAVILEKLQILIQGKAVEIGDILAGVEGCNDQHRHGDIQKDEDQNGERTVRVFHTITPPSSSSANLFMMPVQTKTSSISTRDRAAPRLGLLPCLN